MIHHLRLYLILWAKDTSRWFLEMVAFMKCGSWPNTEKCPQIKCRMVTKPSRTVPSDLGINHLEEHHGIIQ